MMMIMSRADLQSYSVGGKGVMCCAYYTERLRIRRTLEVINKDYSYYGRFTNSRRFPHDIGAKLHCIIVLPSLDDRY